MQDIVSYCIWWPVLTTLRLLLYISLAALPSSFIEDRFRQKLETQWHIKVTIGSRNAGNYDKTQFVCEMIVHNPKLFARIANNGIMALGESYMVRTLHLYRSLFVNSKSCILLSTHGLSIILVVNLVRRVGGRVKICRTC